MLIKITSDNPNFISILQKNPNSFDGIQLRNLKNGVAIGRIISNSEYHIVFQDTKYSFNQDVSAQIDYQSYCNPRAFLSLAGIFLRHMIVDKESFMNTHISWLNKTNAELDDASFQTTIEIANIYGDHIGNGFVIAKYFKEISLEKKLANLYNLKIQANGIFKAINLAVLSAMYISATNEQPWYIAEDLAKKYIRIMKNLAPVPYFVIYLFARRCLPTKEMFNKLRNEISEAAGSSINLVWGNTQEQRLSIVNDLILNEAGQIPEKYVLEIGCGEMDYPYRFLGKLQEDGIWYASDIEDYSRLVERISGIRKRELNFIHDINSIAPCMDSVMLAVEVIEHMKYDDAINLMVSKITHHLPKRVLITTPNYDFNKYYAIDRFRHPDHHFELTEDAFRSFIWKTLAGVDKYYKTNFFGIGDSVNGNYMSLGCILERI